MTVLVTGGTGFVGLNLVHELDAEGYDVVVLHRTPSSAHLLPNHIETIAGDLLDPDSYAEIIDDADSVVHLAALLGGGPEKTHQINVEGTATLAEQCEDHGVDNFVFTSTIHAHPDISRDQLGPYERSKAEAERRLIDLDPTFDYTIVYPTAVFGPRDYGLTRYEHFRIVESNPVLVPPLYLHQSYNVVHVDEVIAALRDAIEGRGGRRTVVSGKNRTAVSLYREIADVIESDCRILPVPKVVTNSVVVPTIDFLHERGVSPVDGDVISDQTDVGTVPEAFEGRKPIGKYDIETTLRDVYDWYCSVGLL